MHGPGDYRAVGKHMNPVLEEILRTGQVRTSDGDAIKVHSCISSEGGEFLGEIISELEPVRSLEVGLAFGISALFICDALKRNSNARHIVIDPNQFNGTWKGIGINNLRKAGYGEVIQLYDIPSCLALPRLEADGVQIDFAFIDGMHTFDYAMVDFFYIDKLLRVGGVVVLDDGDLPSIRKLCRFILTNRSYSVFQCLCLGRTRDRKLSFKRRLIHRAAQVSELFKRLVKPEFFEIDIELGLNSGSRCIALRKDAEDTRRWDFHRDF